MTTSAAPTGFHIRNWGTLGWIETGLKVVAIIFGLLAFFNSGSGDLVIGGNQNIVAVAVLALMTLIMIGVFFVRFSAKEIVSIVFGLFNALGHAGLLIALLRTPEASGYGILFGIFMVLGEVVRARYFQVSGYTEGGMSTARMVMASRSFLVIYALITLALIL
ncbi:MAG: hypothetical protein KME04_11135 [Pleurocapsa minor GSE-CHR-MK-17-07R]|jgi:hypothetical protein|nr:hypothetical protein [Pleurocapsa minor GSE-CHR-MK 17-07R]